VTSEAQVIPIKIQKLVVQERSIAGLPEENEIKPPEPKIKDIYDTEEFYLFTCIVAREASPQGNYADNYEAALDVATVIMNRLPYWGGTITKVCSAYGYRKDGTKYYQFSTYPNYWQCTPQDYEIQACKDALNGKRSLGKNVLFFCTKPSYDKSKWFQSKVFVLYRHGHMFCANEVLRNG